jgi:hypothetical protein
MSIALHELVVRSLHLVVRSFAVILVALFNRLFRDTCQKQTSHADHTSVSAIIRR